jgi:hypothetical protein
LRSLDTLLADSVVLKEESQMVTRCPSMLSGVMPAEYIRAAARLMLPA